MGTLWDRLGMSGRVWDLIGLYMTGWDSRARLLCERVDMTGRNFRCRPILLIGLGLGRGLI